MSIETLNEIIWEPIKGTSQELALDTRCHHTLYHGARGPGKTDTQLMRFRRNVGKGYGAFWRGVIFDRAYKNLDDLIAKSKRWFYAFDDGAEFKSSKSDYKWVWPTGEELLFRQFKNEDDYWNYHGQEFPFIGWNELCKYPDAKPYEAMTSCNRSSWTYEKDCPKDKDGKKLFTPQELPQIPLEVFSTTNPYGPGHNWVKRRFIDPVPNGHVHKTVVEVFHPALKENVKVTKTQIAIFGSYKENIYLQPEYVATLEGITDENKRKAWLEGDWDITAGGAFDDIFNKQIHILPRFIPPKSWRIDRSLDWGSSHPAHVGYYAEANGEEATVIYPGGYVRKFAPPPGTIIQIGEKYFTKSIGSNEGLRMSAKAIAEELVAYEKEQMAQGWFSSQPWPGPADNQIRDVREADVDTIEKKMSDAGIRWTESDKSPGSRKNGLQLMRDRLEACLEGEGPGLYFTENCRGSLSTIPTLPRDEDDMDDVDTDAEDHPYDSVRYRVLKGSNRIAKSVRVTTPH